MAEARMAVAPHPAFHRFGHEVDTSIRVPQLHVSKSGVVVYIPPPRNLLRYARRKLWHVYANVRLAFQPLPMPAVIAVTGSVIYWVIQSDRGAWQRSGKLADLLWRLDSMNPMASRFSTKCRIGYLTSLVCGSVLLSVTAVQRGLLRQLLAYHGWLYERKEKSLATKVWGALLKYVFIRRSRNDLHAYENALPTLPLPTIQETVPKYLETMEPLLNPEQMAEMRSLAADFLKKEGPKLQWYLRLKWLISPNYISDWWLDYVYLRGRDPIAINSNWYGVTYARWSPTKNQAARAASAVYELLKCRRNLESDTFEPQMIQGMVPLCMNQYEHIFSTTRVPGIEQDTLVKCDSADSRHIVVMHRGRFFRVLVYSPNTNRILRPLELQAVFLSILNDDEPAEPTEKDFAALTCINRSEWARIREQQFVANAINRSTLEIIEKAVFVLSFDEESPETLVEEAKGYLTGNGTNRWADKSFNLVVTKNAKCGVHVEHAWGDAPTFAHLLEICSAHDEQLLNFNPDGTVKAFPEDEEKIAKGTFKVYPAERLRFHVTKELRVEVADAVSKYTTQINDLDLHIERFDTYGKRIAKSAQCSPDAWIQMAFQLAYWRDQGRFDQTYESSMTRLFNRGRTETIRSASNESVAFVRAMEDPTASNATRLKLLQAASERHQHYSHDAMTGHGVDRHLFGLYVISVGKNIPSPFLNKALSGKWRLSTSQVPVRQVPELHVGDQSLFETCNGGFGPVADDGYGILYCIWGEDLLYFTISSKVSCPTTNSVRMGARIAQALKDMATIVPTPAPKAKKELK